MTGVILAAGCARRLRPLTDSCPKCLLEVGGASLLGRTVDAMLSAGITDFVIVTGYRAEMVRTHIMQHPAYATPGITFRFIDNPDYEHNNNIFSLWLAGAAVRGREFLLMDSDILCDPEAVRRIATHSDSALALNRHELGEEEIKVVVDGSGQVVELNKTCDPSTAIGESVGIEHMTAAYSAALFDELQTMIEVEGLDNVFYERAFERLIPRGHTFAVVDTTDLFSFEIDTPSDLELATERLPSWMRR